MSGMEWQWRATGASLLLVVEYIGRSRITSGGLQRLIAEDGLCGVTSNPAIFEKAINGILDYAEALRGLWREPGLDANARYERLIIEDMAYQRYGALFSGVRWEALVRRGAMTQRVLWASTGTNNPTYRDVMYMEELIGPKTVNTVPPATFEAFSTTDALRVGSLKASIRRRTSCSHSNERGSR